MFTVSCSEQMQCPPAVVFAFAGDYRNDPKWRSGVLSMEYQTAGPPGIGTRTREVMRSMGRTAVTIGEITEYSAARTAFRSLSGPVACDGSREFAGSPSGTIFTYSLTLRPAGTLRLLEPLLRWIFRRQIRQDLRRLKGQLEAPTQAWPPQDAQPT